MIDDLIECPVCSAPFCYQQIHEGVASWNCLSCGYLTNSNMMVNTEFTKAYEQTLPQLYIDIKKVDESGLVWYPQIINKSKEGKGIIFANGTGADNWGWTFAPMALVTEEEKEKFKDKKGGYLTYKTDMVNAKHFHKTQFSLAVNELQIT